MKKHLFFSFMAMVVVLFVSGSIQAEPWHTTNTLLWHAVPNECYAGLGGIDYPAPDAPPGYPSGITPGDGYQTPVVCPERPNPRYDPDPEVHPDEPEFLSGEKTNDSYIWALTQEGNNLWFASAANVLCTTAGVFLGELSYGEVRAGHWEEPVRLPLYVCEHQDSMVARDDTNFPYITDMLGDWRPSKLYRYDLTDGSIENLTTKIYDAGGDDGEVFNSLLGIRCAGSHKGVVFFAGGSEVYDGVYMFAFDANTYAYLGYHVFTNARQIRKMIVVKNYLYTGVAGANLGQGQILRWRGNRDNLWDWVVVGRVTGPVTELAEYVDGQGRSRIVVNALGVWVSPAIRWRFLNFFQGWGWKQIWSAFEYEPDTIAQLTYGGGALAQLGEWVYWGTMHIPYHAYYMHTLFNGDPETQEEQYALVNGTFRTTTIWRARNLESDNPEVQLVYGESELPADNDGDNVFESTPTGWTPISGPSGFGNPNNNYTWTMQRLDDHLFVGTMDQTLLQGSDVGAGADLWRFDLDSNGVAEAEFTDGGGNMMNYGIRCLIASDDGTKLYIGTANPANLRHEGVGEGQNGGWELRELSSESAPPPS